VRANKNMARILVTARFDENALARLSCSHEVSFDGWQDTGVFPTGGTLVKKLNDGRYRVYVNEGDLVPAAVIERLQYTRLICVARATPGNVDITSATGAGIVVTHTPGRNAVAVAEYTIGLILDLVRHISDSNRLVRDGDWLFQRFPEVEGLELEGRTLGLVGVGHVGREVARRLRAFNMHILGYDHCADAALTSSAGVQLVSLEQLMGESDFVSIHAAVTPETIGLIGAHELALMKPSAYFINTARAVITDEQALHTALRDRRIAGAALDVFVDEPVRCDHPLASLDNVLFTPHLAGATREVVTRHSHMIEQDIEAYVGGSCPPHAVNPEAWRPHEEHLE
jgi:phosphoglycerate dehydrogenase-like enzyme